MTRAAPLERAAELLAGRIGLRVEGSMRSRVQRAVRQGADARGESPSAYVAALLADEDALQGLVDAITVQESGFFRDPPHFEVLVRRALPALAGPGVVWSAGCANGQEAWSLAIALEEAGAADWRVLATDVSAQALARAEAGRYTERESAGLSPIRRARFLTRAGDGEWEIGARLRRRVSFLSHNLAEESPPAEAGACRVVFCRNVLIYLAAEATARTLASLRARMPSDGWLFTGSSETLAAGARLFAPHRVDGVYVYRPRSARFARPQTTGDGGTALAGPAASRRFAAAPRSRPQESGAADAPRPAVSAGPRGSDRAPSAPRADENPPLPEPADREAHAAGAPSAPRADENPPLPAPADRGAPAAGSPPAPRADGNPPLPEPADGETRAAASPSAPRADENPPLPKPADLVADGEAHVAAGRFGDAVTAFRKACFLAPDDPLPLLGLGLALERDDRAAAARAFRAARAALARAGDDIAATGWSGAELARLLDAKLTPEG